MEKQHYYGYSRRRMLFWGMIIILVGLLFLLNNLDYLDVGEIVGRYWPLLIIFLGVYIILRADRGKVATRLVGDHSILCESDNAYYSNVFGDIKVTIASKNFQAGKVSTVFGDVKVDLENLDIASGEKNLYLSGVFGDIKVSVPKNVPFFAKGSAVAGDIKIMDEKTSGFSTQLTYKSEGYDSADKKLNIFASHVFGDIKIW